MDPTCFPAILSPISIYIYKIWKQLIYSGFFKLLHSQRNAVDVADVVDAADVADVADAAELQRRNDD